MHRAATRQFACVTDALIDNQPVFETSNVRPPNISISSVKQRSKSDDDLVTTQLY